MENTGQEQLPRIKQSSQDITQRVDFLNRSDHRGPGQSPEFAGLVDGTVHQDRSRNPPNDMESGASESSGDLVERPANLVNRTDSSVTEEIVGENKPTVRAEQAGNVANSLGIPLVVDNVE